MNIMAFGCPTFSTEEVMRGLWRHPPGVGSAGRNKRRAGLGTLLLDLLSRDEDSEYERRFDIALLGARLDDAARWFKGYLGTRRQPAA